MTDIDPSTSTASSPRHATAGFPAEAEGPVTAWVGWIFFAALIMIMVGIFQLIEGLVGIFNRGYYQVAETGLIVHVGYSTWGWVQLILGALVGLTGIGLIVGNAVARVLGVSLLAINAILQIVWFSAAPLWAFLMIILDVVIIYQLMVNWSEEA